MWYKICIVYMYCIHGHVITRYMYMHVAVHGPCVNHNNLWNGYLALLDSRVHVATLELGLRIRRYLYSTRSL